MRVPKEPSAKWALQERVEVSLLNTPDQLGFLLGASTFLSRRLVRGLALRVLFGRDAGLGRPVALDVVGFH